MRTARVRTPDGVLTGEYEDETVVVDGEPHDLADADVELLAPVDPPVFYCVARNYGSYIEENAFERPEGVSFFLKPPVSVHPPESTIPYPSFSSEVGYAGELAAVIGTECRNVPREEVPDVVRGYTIMNDVDAKDQPRISMRKAFDAAAPLGPCIATDVDPTDIEMETRIDGERRQRANTGEMDHPPDEVVSFLSERFTLRPDDVIAFGSPANPGPFEAGNEITVHYEGIGTLRNTLGTPD
jgi:2-keto-4-pentenoate hydratase/2-oxohepta-3-ene-1,7-dioic acid hydratase in catechol pathway